MANFLTLNGINIPADYHAGTSRDDDVVGSGIKDAYDGSLLSSIQGYKKRWKLRTAVDTQANTDAVRKLLRGDVDHWDFETDTWSDKGAGPGVATAGAARATGGGKYGSARLAEPNNATFTFPTALSGTAWTALYWSRLNAGAWAHYINQGNTNYWTAGVTSGSFTHSTISSGQLVLQNPASGFVRDFDDLVVFNFAMPAAWASQIFAYVSVSAWSTAPRLLVGGDIGSATVLGKVGPSKNLPSSLNGAGFVTTNELMDFELWEV